jgi:chemotaxis protein methyltransferase CheR
MKQENQMVSAFQTAGFIEIKNDEFDKLRILIYNNIGIILSQDKRTLLTGRLQKILRRDGYANFSEYYQHLVNDKSGESISELANTISTNHTFFGREKDHFDYFSKVALPDIILKKGKDKDLRIWSAGCSSGEEPYTLVMLMMDLLGLDYKLWNAGCLATDISEKVLNIARFGVYPKERMSGVNPTWTKKYFEKSSASGDMKVIEKVRNEVTFRRFNLMNTEFPFKKKFDVIFCRNVMIYFDEETRIRLIDKFYNLLNDGGYFFIGHSETVNRKFSKFNYIMPAVYQK